MSEENVTDLSSGNSPELARALEATPAASEDVRERALAVLDFLDGSAPLAGRWFHERPAGAGPYWWRRYLAEIRAALLRTPSGEGERGLIMRAMLEAFPWSPDIRQGHFERAADAVIAALRSEAQGQEEPVAWLVERRGVEMFRWHPVDVYLGRQHAENIARVMRDGEWDVRVVALYRAAHPTDRSESDD